MKSGLHPTLWRTCRILASRRRLKLLELLIRRGGPGMVVRDIAQHMGWSIPVTSQELRRLQSRGLLQCRRTGRYVRYRFGPDISVPDAVRLAPVLRAGFLDDSTAFIVACYRLATGFTHPRRIEILKALGSTRLTRAQIRARVAMSSAALSRHLAKLMRRGLVRYKRGIYWIPRPSTVLGRTLLALVRP